jgi:hypothetical protein
VWSLVALERRVTELATKDVVVEVSESVAPSSEEEEAAER